MSEKFLAHVDQTWKMEALSQALRAQGIEPRVRQKAREYVSIITGMGLASYDVFVADEQFLRAMQVIQQLPTGEAFDKATAPKNYFRRVIALSLLGVVLAPLAFNAIATWQYRALWSAPEVSRGKKIFAGIVLLLAWVAAVGEVSMIIRS